MNDYDATGGEQGWIMKNTKVEFGQGVVEGLAEIGIDANKEVARGIFRARINELRLDAGIARIENQQWLCVLDKETGMMIDPLIGLEKFAELIVAECLEACNRANEIRHFVPPTQEQVVLSCMREIEQHFGVE
jgi:hypothetical protein